MLVLYVILCILCCSQLPAVKYSNWVSWRGRRDEAVAPVVNTTTPP